MSTLQDLDNIKRLITLALDRQASPQQLNELIEAIKQDSRGQILQLIEFAIPDTLPVTATTSEAARWDNILHSIFDADILSSDHLVSDKTTDSKPATNSPASIHYFAGRRVHFLKTAWFRYAAVLLLVAATATFLYLHNQPLKEITENRPVITQPDIPPGGNKAILTLADGSTIILDSAATGNLAQQGTTKILKLDMGSLAYQEGTANGEVLYNTISTPKGGQYQITLPDGTKVWLNAASSIRFPTVFIKDRKVTVTGELYFEVAANAKKPFVVDAKGSEIQVLGTSFNVMAYDNEESVNTTLVEGAVKVSDDKSEILIQPGEQAKAGGNWNGIKVIKANIKETLAWKNGEFIFRRSPIEYIMRQIERWYDVEVKYEREMPNVQLSGKVPRTENVSELLKIFEATKIVQFKIENKKIIVSPFKK